MSNDKVKPAVAVAGAFLLVLAVGTLGWAMLRPQPSSDATASWQDAAGQVPDTPSTTVTSEPPPTTPPPPTPTPTKNNVVPRSTETKRPEKSELPPPVTPPEKPANCPPTYVGANAPMADVKRELVRAASRDYWDGVVPDPALTVKPRPVVTIPADLMKAIAWQESGWQSAIRSCDTGVGIMQITEAAGTADFINNRFGENFDPNTLAGNVDIGAAYLEWLTVFFGIHFYDQHFRFTDKVLDVNGNELALLDVVLAAYNVGWGNVIASWNDRTLSVGAKGRQYANTVKALRSNCPCLSY